MSLAGFYSYPAIRGHAFPHKMPRDPFTPPCQGPRDRSKVLEGLAITEMVWHYLKVFGLGLTQF